jgi:hypothetical protein
MQRNDGSIIFFALLLVVSLSACSAQSEDQAETSSRASASEQVAEDGFEPLFDGETLEGWHRHEDLPGDQVGGEWEVIDGAIVGDQDPPGHGGFLVTDETYDDYVLRMEANLDYPVDSGIFLRVGPEGKSHQLTLDYRPEGTVGAVYMAYLQGFVHENNVKDQFNKEGWNDLKVRIEGNPPHIQFWLNGEKVTDFQHTEETAEGAPESGFIGLQVHPGASYEEGKKVRFRNIEIKELE